MPISRQLLAQAIKSMEVRLLPDTQLKLDRFCRQYLQLQPELDYPDEEYLRSDAVQEFLYARLFQENALSHELPKRYQLKVLKELTSRIEASIQDWDEQGISDNLMNHLSSLLSAPLASEATSAQQKAFVTYTLSSLSSHSNSPPTVTLLEARNLVAAAGTTGLRTWEAAFHLGNYLCTNHSFIKGKSVLELGSGTGYISILCAKYLDAEHTLATDGSDDVVAGLATNFYLNGLQDSSLIDGKELRWGHALIGGEHSEWNAGRKIEVVLGADVTYDSKVFPALVSTFQDLVEFNPEIQILIAATIRNPKTFQEFFQTCQGSGFITELLEFPIVSAEKQEGPFYSDKVPIELCLITKAQRR